MTDPGVGSGALLGIFSLVMEERTGIASWFSGDDLMLIDVFFAAAGFVRGVSDTNMLNRAKMVPRENALRDIIVCAFACPLMP